MPSQGLSLRIYSRLSPKDIDHYGKFNSKDEFIVITHDHSHSFGRTWHIISPHRPAKAGKQSAASKKEQ